jgi:pimeloyl-ACP methyl ester carboxylesterase
VLICALSAAPHRARHAMANATEAPCPDSDFTCVTLTVPLDHFDPANTQTIEVTFAILRAKNKNARRGAFVTAVGGPGASGLQSADSYAASYDASIRRTFDIVFFDQRGVGKSGGFDCPDAVATYYQSDGRAKTPAQERAIINAARTFATDCLQRLPADKVKFYGTRQAVEDLEVFRNYLGDDKLWLYGESYGTQFGQWYAAVHPDRVAALVIDGVVDLSLGGPQFLRDTTSAFNHVLADTLRACNQDRACRRDARQDVLRFYDQLARQLERGPSQVAFPLPDGTLAQRELGLSDLETAMASFLYSEPERMLIQRALASAANDDLVPLLRLFYSALGLDPQTLTITPDPSYSDAVYYTVTCNDYEYFTGPPEQRAERYLRAGDGVDHNVPRMNSVFYGDLPCAFWPRADPVPKYETGFATLIPTLVLVAEADPATPADQGRAVFKRLSNAYLITQSGGPHVIYGRGVACIDDVVTAFLVKDVLPAQVETRCDGVIATDYVPIAPTDARTYKNVLEALHSAENEILYAPEYYYWDLSDDAAIGCHKGGVAAFSPANEARGTVRFTLTNCQFARGFGITGTGRYNPNNDRFTFKVDVAGAQQGTLDYVREGDVIQVTGTLDGKPVNLRK